MSKVTDQMVDAVVINGENIPLGNEMSVGDATNYLSGAGFGDTVNGSTPVVNGTTLSFEQQNGEKGIK